MTYLQYLLIFIVSPIITQLVIIFILDIKFQKPILKTASMGSLTILSIIAFVYTTPWDNYFVANHIWYYDPNKILGIVFGYVPIEEYTFFFLETIFVSLLIILALQFDLIVFPDKLSLKFSKTKLIHLNAMLLIWIFCIICYFSQIKSLQYFTLLLIWGIPPITIQMIIGWQLIKANLRTFILIILVTGIYLSVTDLIAIYYGIWAISSKSSIGLVFLVLPIEEIIFFYITVSLLLFGFILMTYLIQNHSKKFKQMIIKRISILNTD